MRRGLVIMSLSRRSHQEVDPSCVERIAAVADLSINLARKTPL